MMSSFPTSLFIDPQKVEEFLRKVDNKKKLEALLMDPQIIEMSRKSAETRQVLASIVYKLQEERDRKRRLKSCERKELAQTVRWFDCMNFMKSLTGTPRQGDMMRPHTSSEEMVRQRNKLTVCTPCLDAKQDEPLAEGPSLVSGTKKGPEMRLSLSNLKGEALSPLNIIEFCASETGKAMITSLFRNSDLKDFFNMKGALVRTESHRAMLSMDSYNCSDLNYTQYQTMSSTFGQATIILRSCNNRIVSIWRRGMVKEGGLTTSATQTILSGSCSYCSTECMSSESYITYDDPTRRSIICDPKSSNVMKVSQRQMRANSRLSKKFLRLSQNTPCKISKSQSAMYTTEYSECDCDNLSSFDEASGRYLARILAKADAPNVDFLTTPDVLITYSDGLTTDSESSCNSCTACRQLAHNSSESFNREPSEIWTKKRLKTSCESCLTKCKTELPRKFYNDSSTNGTISDDSEECLEDEEVPKTDGTKKKNYSSYDREQVSNNEKASRSILDSPSTNADMSNMRNDQSFLQEQKNETLNSGEMKCEKNNMGAGEIISSIHNSGRRLTVVEGSKKKEMSGSESLSPTTDERQEDSVKGVKSKRTREVAHEDSPPSPSPLHEEESNGFINKTVLDNRSASDSMDEKSGSSGYRAPRRKQRKKTRNKAVSEESIADSSSSSSLHQVRPLPRRLKASATLGQCSVPPQAQQKIIKQKSKQRNCVVM